MEGYFVPQLTDGIIALDAFVITYFIAFNFLACIAGISKPMLKILTGLFFLLLVIRTGLGIGYIRQCNDLINGWLNTYIYDYTLPILINIDVFRALIAAFFFEDETIFQCGILLILTIMLWTRVIRS